MISDHRFGKASPLTWAGSFPVYLAAMIAAAHVLTMIVTALVMGVQGGSGAASAGPLAAWTFSWEAAIQRGWLWQFVTYAFVNPPSHWTVVQLVMLVIFGSEVEKFLGRMSFLWLYVLLVLAAPALLTALGFAGIRPPLAGGSLAHFGVFLAFVFIYPRAEIFFRLQARWVAVALVGIYTLQGIATRDWMDIALLWWTAAVAFAYLKWEDMEFSFPKLLSPTRPFSPARSARSARPVRPAREHHSSKTIGSTEEEQDLHDSIDPILEKIARRGIGSLTRAERNRLESARDTLIRKDRQH